MRLLELKDNGDVGLTKDILNDVQPYAILSHTWGGDDDEVTFQDMTEGTGKAKFGYRKIRFCIEQAARDGLRYCWVDTCCINKADSTELAEAINSMFRWYRNAVKCYVYLSDISTNGQGPSNIILDSWELAFRSSRWFTRGWTLQELIAPPEVVFYCFNGHFLGNKTSLEQQIHEITGIAPRALRGAPLSEFNLDTRLLWAKKRQTTRQEDKIYSLLGIFDVYMPLIYGEGRKNALRRLLESISSARKHHLSADTISSRTGSDSAKRQKIYHHYMPHDSADQSAISPSSDLRCYNEYPQPREFTSPPGTSHGIGADTKQSLIDQLYFAKIDERLTSLTPAQGTTCLWFFKSTEYLSWNDRMQDSEHGGFLWIKGNPGTGKSTLMKLLYDDARQKARGNASQITISFFFLARGTEEEKSVAGLYRSLLHQLFERAPELKERLDWMTSDGARVIERTGWHEQALKQTLTHAVPSLGSRSLTVFVDALDECEKDEVADMVSFFEGLCDCARNSEVRLQVCFSSRHYPTIVIQKGIEIILENQIGHTEDIEQYIKSKLRLGKSKAAEELRSQILKKSSNIFLWVVLVLDILNSEYPDNSISLKKIRERLNQIPRKLSELFEMILRRDERNPEQLQLCLKLVLFAARPLKPAELYFAVQLGLDKESFGHWDRDDIDPEQMNTFVRSSSKGLAEVTRNKASEIQFIHESVRDFLLGKYAGQSPEASGNFVGHSHEILKNCCIAQLNTSVMKTIVAPDPLPKARETADLRNSLYTQFPFLEYAVLNVYRHANHAQHNGMDQERFLADFNMKQWIYLNNIIEKYDNRRYKESASLLYILAEKDLAALVRVHPQGSTCFKEEDERYGAPILAALANGNDEAVKAFMEIKLRSQAQQSSLHSLYESYWQDTNRSVAPRRDFTYSRRKGVTHYMIEYCDIRIIKFFLATGDCNLVAGNHNGLTPSLSACGSSRYNVAMRPLDASLDIETKDHRGLTYLARAAADGKEAVVNFLLERNADIEAKDNGSQTPLLWAARKGHETVVRLLLERNADIEAKDNSYSQTPLLWAAKNSYETAVKLLLERNANTEAKDDSGQTPLLWAAEKGHETVVKLLLERNADIEAKDNNGQTPLYWAAAKGHETAVKLLLERDADTETKDNNGRTPLFWAVANGLETAVKLLLERNADIEAKDNYGQTPLFWAVANGLETVVKLLLERNANTEAKDDSGQTPLLWAAEKGHETVVKLLLERNADIEAKDNNGQTPLYWAAAKGHETAVKLLLERDADTETKDNNGRTPLFWAVANGLETAVKLLLERNTDIEAKDNNGQTPLYWAAAKGLETAVKLLLERNADIEAKDNNGRTPLFWAVANGLETVVKLLLERNANIEAKNNYGQRPLCWAAENGHETVVKLLLERNADIEAKDNYGQTPLSWAAEKGHETVVKLLLERNADIEAKDSRGQTPLCWAAAKGHETVVKLLLKRNSDIEAKGSRGQTPLCWAAAKGHETVVKLLLERNADIEAKDNCYSQTPLLWAAENGHETAVKLLLERNADIEAKDNRYSQTPLSWAAKNGHETVVKLLLERNANIEAEDSDSKTPLMWAVTRSRQPVIRLLVREHQKKGIDTSAPFFLAVKGGNRYQVQAFLEEGVNPSMKDEFGQTPIWYAYWNGHEEVVRVLLDAGASKEEMER
ncbi:hypothetical protein ACMFMG_010047 [Clarireedia jacksonii]